MKVAYLINQYPKVSHSFIRREILALERKGIDVVRIALRGWNERVPDPQDRAEATRTRYVLQQGPIGVLLAVLACAVSSPGKVIRAFSLATRMSRGADRALIFHWIYFAEACVVARWLQAERAVHVHAHFGTNAAEVAMLAGVLADLPYSFTVHGPEEFDRPQSLGLTEKIRRARFVVAISSFGRSQLFRWCDHEHWNKIRVVHCGIELDDWRPVAGVASRVFVCVGRLCEQKGQLLLLAALRKVLDTGEQCEVVLAGDGEMRPAIEALARSLALGDNVTITGWLSAAQVREQVARARALILPSFAEGLPVVLMEAMALGKPVLSTYVAGIPELISHERNGWLFPAGDVDAVANAMKACLRASASELSAIGACARESVMQRHDIDNEAAKLAELFAADDPSTSRAAAEANLTRAVSSR